MPISSSLFDTFSLHATVTKHGSASLEIDIPVAELREETRRLLRALFVIFFALILVSLLLAMVEGATDGLGTLLGFGIPTLVLALFYPIIIVSWKNRFFRHEIVEITPNGVWMTVKTVTYTAFLKEFLWTPQSDIESNKEQEVIIKNRSLERGEFFRARVAPSRAANEVDMRRVVLGDLEFGRGLNIIELASIVSEINAFLE